jgi:hypothetical protein
MSKHAKKRRRTVRHVPKPKRMHPLCEQAWFSRCAHVLACDECWAALWERLP